MTQPSDDTLLPQPSDQPPWQASRDCGSIRSRLWTDVEGARITEGGSLTGDREFATFGLSIPARHPLMIR